MINSATLRNFRQVQKIKDMKARELRIGNFINGTYHDYDDGSQEDIENETLCKVVTLDVSGNGDYPIYVYSDEDIEHFSDFEPIPLTEEWLVNFGFNAKSINHNFRIESNVDFQISSALRNCKTDERSVFYLESKFGTKIEYVHQLQNLYFALTGEELTLNP